MHRRHALWTLAAAALLAACSTPTPPPAQPPIVFVHGNGDSAALWTTTLWRFESNGWPRERLHAIDLPNPLARDEDNVPQAGRSSTTEHAQYLAAEVDKVLARTGERQVVLVGNSRGGNAIRNYVQNFGGDTKVSMAVLGGTPNHGVWALKEFRPNSEFNGVGALPGGPEPAQGSGRRRSHAWRTLDDDPIRQQRQVRPARRRVDRRQGQADERQLRRPGAEGGEERGAAAARPPRGQLPPGSLRADLRVHHRRAPATLAVAVEARPVLDGMLSGIGPGGPSNLPLVGATLEVYAVDASTGGRQGAARHSKVIGADGRWGPFTADSRTAYEFVISAPGYATTHVYRSPFARSSGVVNLRAERLADADKSAASVVTLSRPRGYFGLPRDRITLDGSTPAPGIPPGVAGVSTSKLKLGSGAGRPVAAAYESGAIQERLVGLAWPAAENRVVVLELTN
jgi:triacylglycerol lipase